MFDKILIANRGEIACRIARTCRRLGIAVAGIHSLADADALHVKAIGESIAIGGAPASESYLRIDAVIEAAKMTGAQAIHPGFGFLAENPAFARAVEAAGLVFIGPTPEVIERLGDKALAKQEAHAAGVPIIPGSATPSEDRAEVERTVREIGLPVMLKAAAGGGGKGMRVVTSFNGIADEIESAMREAKNSFGSAGLIVEKLIAHGRHIEIQILGDGRGGAIHLGERDCSLQRRHQKVWEEGPSPVLTAEARARIGETCAKAMREMQYLGVGTVEFLYEDGEFYFIEMNTRIQVEHPVTEMITDIDLVLEQIRVAAGGDLPATQKDIVITGHAIECRINAENPVTFRPSPGRIQQYHPPGGLGVRIDSAVYLGYVIPPYYDSLVGKLIVHGKTRAECLMRLRRALDEMVVDGIETTLPLFRALVREPGIIDGDYHIHWLEEFLASGGPT